MKKGYFELTFLLFMLGYGLFAWIGSSRNQAEAAAKAKELSHYLRERLGANANDLKALSNAADIEVFFYSSLWTFFVVLYVVCLMLLLHQFARTELSSKLAQVFVRVWTWRP